MAVDDWISNLFQSEQTRGLSGGAAATVALDESNPFYNYRLRRHVVEGDLVADPALLWSGMQAEADTGGLHGHLNTDRSSGIAEFTDVLVILSLEDYSKAAQSTEEPWPQVASRVLVHAFDDFCRREKFSRRFAHRPLGFRIICDGSADMGGQSLGLAAGEFVTGLLPNLYTGPVSGSTAVIAVYVNLPGIWEGYQEVGRLYNDQVLFTIGSSWLDTFHHPSLQEAAIYRLNQNPDGSFVHIVSPDLQDKYQVTVQPQGELSVMTLATRDGEPLAHILLALLDISNQGNRGPRTVPPGSIPNDENALHATFQPGDLAHSTTVVPEAPNERIFALQERGALLQKVHFSNFMLGYDVHLGVHGELGTAVANKAATFQVRKRLVSVVAHVGGVTVGGKNVTVGEEVPIEGDVIIDANGQQLEYRDLRGLRVERWPYVGEIRRPASSNYMMWGLDYMIGRSQDCRVTLPDQPENANIVWKPSVGEGAVIRSRTGDIPKSRFYTDSIMVGSEHAAVNLRTPDPVVVSKNRNCFVYVRRGVAVFPLYPTASGKEPTEMTLQPADEILVGNCLFRVGFTPIDDGANVAPPPPVQLAGGGEEATERMSAEDAAHLSDLTPPQPHEPTAAQGLGHKGEAPDPVPLADTGPDSILGDFRYDEMEEQAEAPPEPSPDEESTLEFHADNFNDQDTMPGRSLPREVLAAMEGTEDDALAIYEDDEEEVAEPPAEESPPPPPAAESEAEWEEEDSWTGDSGQHAQKGTTSPDAEEEERAASVPPPFPNVEEEPVASPEEPPPPPVEAPPESESPPTPPPVPEVAADSSPAADAANEVIAVDDASAQFELGRAMQLVQVGWVVNGTVTLGNHSGADLILPENRIVEEQTFIPVDYLELKVRGRKGNLKILSTTELLIDGKDVEETEIKNPEGVLIDVIRRDDVGDEDFVVRMELIEDPTLPNPRSRLLALDAEDDLAAALVTRGLPTRSSRVLQLSNITIDFNYDGETVTLSKYLDTYKKETGFNPFFIQRGNERFVTAPEDGADIVLNNEDHLIVGNVLYALRKN
jgi:hypothetical protein